MTNDLLYNSVVAYHLVHKLYRLSQGFTMTGPSDYIGTVLSVVD